MDQLYFTQSGAAWSSRQLIWQSDMAIDPAKYGIYDLKCGVEVNKAGELSFLMTKSCSSYNLFSKERSVLTLIRDNSITLFRGVVKLIETDLFFQRTITANSDLIYLSDSVFEPHGDDIEETPIARFRRIIDHHNVEMQGDPEKQIQVGNFTFTQGADKVEKYTKNGGYKDTMSQLQNDFKDFYGFYNIRYNDDYSQKWLDYTETTPSYSTVKALKFAVNVEDYQFKDTVDDLFTVLIPCGGDNLTLSGLALSGQERRKKVSIRQPDQTLKAIDVYVVDKYLKIVDGINEYGYIYLPESFTVDSNNIGVSGINRTIPSSWSGRQKGSGGGSSGDGFIYTEQMMLSGWNPAEMGLYYKDKKGVYHETTDTTPVAGQHYFKRKQVTKPTNGANPDDDWSGQYTYTPASLSPSDNPKNMGLYERRAFTIGVYIATNDTKPLNGKTYYRRSSDS